MRHSRRVYEMIRRIKADRELREFPDCTICKPQREVIATSDVGVRALGFTHEKGCPLAEPEDGPAVEYFNGEPM